MQEEFIVHERVVIRLGTDTQMEMMDATHTHAVITNISEGIELFMNRTMERVSIISRSAFIRIKEAYTMMYKGVICAKIQNMRVTYVPKPRKTLNRPPRPPGVSVHEILDAETLVVVCPIASKFAHFTGTEHVAHVDISPTERAYFVQRYNAYKYVDENGVKSVIDVFD